MMRIARPIGLSRGVLARPRLTVALIAAFVIGLGAPLAAPTSVIAQGFGVGDVVVVNTDALNMRSGPGTATTVERVLVSGTVGTVTDGPISGPDWTWYEISVTGLGAGWVAGAFLALSDAVDGEFSIGQEVEVDTDALNLRAGPGLGEEVLVVLTAGWPGTVRGGPVSADGYTWYELFVGLGGESNTVGWAAGEFLAIFDPNGATFPIGAIVAVNTDVLNVRAEPGLDGRIVDAIFFGAVGEVSRNPVYENGYTWYRLRLPNAADGWVAGEFLILSGDLGFPIGTNVRVATDVLNVRAAPGLDARVVDAIFSGAVGEVSRNPVEADGYTWYRLRLPNAADGWVAGEFLVIA